MNKTLGKHTVGGATVSVVAPTMTFTPGETLDGEVRLVGRDVDREIRTARIEFLTRYRSGDEFRTTTIDRSTLAEDVAVKSGLRETRDVTISIPRATPMAIGSVDVWVKTTFKVGTDTVEDREYLDMEPTDRFRAVLDAMTDFGFVLENTGCWADDSPDGQPFVQQFEFRPTGERFERGVDVIQLFARTRQDKLTVFVVADPDDREWRFDASRGVPRTTFQSAERGEVRDSLDSLVERTVSADD